MPTLPHVLVAGRVHEAGLDLLRQATGITWQLVESTAADAYLPHLAGADALVLRTQPLDARRIGLASRLRIVSRHGVGYDAVDVEALSARGIPLTVVGDVNAHSVAEHTMMMLLAIAKKTVFHDARIRAGDWQCRNLLDGSELRGRRLLLLGFGRIGRLVAEIAAAFGMCVSAHDPFVPSSEMTRRGVEPAPDLMAALAHSDAVSVHMPRSGTEPLLGAAHLAAIKRGAMLVNTARGGIVDEAALAVALRSGQLRGAGLDVLEEEPPAADHPLLSCPNLLLSPHVAGLTEESSMRMAVKAVGNVLDYFAGKLDPALVVNRDAACAAHPVH